MTFADRTTVAGDVEFYHGTYLNTGSLTAVGSAKHPVYFAATGLTNVGTFTVTGATKIDNDLVQKAGKTVVAAGAVLTEVGSSSSVKIRGGRLDGAGRIKASVSVSGAQVRPGGTKVGTLTVYGSYSGSSSSTLLLDIAKSGADRLAVHGSTSLRGRVIGANSASLGKGTKRTVVTSTGSLSVHPTCVGTTGSGSASRHWTAAASRHALALVLVAGRPKSC